MPLPSTTLERLISLVGINPKHTLHCIALISWICFFGYFCGAFTPDPHPIQPIHSYGYVATFFLYGLRMLSLLVLPQCFFNAVGLLLYDAFKGKVHLRAAPLLAPFVCFRVVTRGNYPRLVADNLAANMETCHHAGIQNFMFEVVTDRRIGLPAHQRLREIVVPSSYKTKSGALYKARALQYCLEEDVNRLQENDWVVHLDEETLLTVGAVHGILNFCDDGRHVFGQGVITYASGEIVNWLTTLADSYRVADDMGKLRLQLALFHRPLFGWKGSFVVTQLAAERAVSFDNGTEGSIAEDCFFAMASMKHGYSYGFIEGELHEKSAFTVSDFLQQRKRWLQGILLTVHSPRIQAVHKALLALSLYAWMTMPLTSMQVLLCPFFPLPKFLPLDLAVTFVGAINLYMYVFGVIKSFSHLCRANKWRLIIYTMGAIVAIPFNIVIENVAVIAGLWGEKKDFFIVQKEREPLIV